MYLCLVRWRWFVISLVVTLGIATYYLLSTPGVYQRTASILIKEDGKSQSINSDVASMFSDMGLSGGKSNVNNELIAIQSPAVLLEAGKQLKLDVNYSEDGTFHPVALYGRTLPVTVHFYSLNDMQSANLDVEVKHGNLFSIVHVSGTDKAGNQVESDDADYVGGIAGQSKSIIRRSAAKCRLSGDNYVGGIAGSGFTITGSRSFVLADGDEYVGAIAGGLESSNSITNLNSALQDSESEQSGNYFVSETLGGIDGVSYAGQAEPLSFQEFCDMTAQEGMPDEFHNVTLNFVANQVTVEAVTVEYGAAFDMANAPELPVKGGYTAEWSDFDHDHVVFDQTIEAVYTPLDSVVQSGDTRNGLPILLAEGAFGTAEVTLTPSSESPGAVGTLLECWEITLPEDHSDSHVLHYLAPSDNTVVYLRDADGSWRKVDTTEDGSYLVFTAMTDETTLAAVEKPGIPLPILIGGAVAAVLS